MKTRIFQCEGHIKVNIKYLGERVILLKDKPFKEIKK